MGFFMSPLTAEQERRRMTHMDWIKERRFADRGWGRGESVFDKEKRLTIRDENRDCRHCSTYRVFESLEDNAAHV